MKYRMGCLALMAVMAAPCLSSGQTDKIEFSNCQSASIVSPDGRWLLEARFILSNCPLTAKIANPTSEEKAAAKLSDGSGVSLFLESVTDRSRRRIPFDGYWGQAAWSPDSKAFFLNDHMGSNMTDSVLYTVDAMKKIDVADAILQADSQAKRYARGHTYYMARKWLDNRTALIQFCGHTDDAPFVQFDFRYRVGLDGSAQRISRRLTKASLGQEDCE